MATPQNRTPKRIVAGIPSPLAGWVTNKAIDSMAPNEALRMDNFVPDGAKVFKRNGYESYATGAADEVETLFEYNDGVDEKFLASGGGSIYDISTAGAVGSPLASGYNSDRWQYVNYKERIFAVNGEDTPAEYNGTTWVNFNFTGSGLTTSDLVNVSLFKERLIFVEKDTAKFWYSTTGAVSGTLTSFDLSSIVGEGGYLEACGSISRDGGDGNDDLFVAIMSTGFVIIYAGTDPSTAANWQLVGKYKIANPIGRRCLTPIGGDLGCITEDGYVLVGQVIGYARTRNDTVLNANIANEVRRLAQLYKTFFGWSAKIYPRQSWLLFNVPTGNDIYEQHIVNTNTGAWFRFTNHNGPVFATYKEDLYFSDASGNVFKADSGSSDNGTNIQSDCETSFNFFGDRTRIKRFLMLRPILTVNGDVPLSIAFNTDFNRGNTPYDASVSTTGGTSWDVSPWDTSDWSPETVPQTNWLSIVASPGYSASVRLKTDTQAERLEWNNTDVTYEAGYGI